MTKPKCSVCSPCPSCGPCASCCSCPSCGPWTPPSRLQTERKLDTPRMVLTSGTPSRTPSWTLQTTGQCLGLDVAEQQRGPVDHQRGAQIKARKWLKNDFFVLARRNGQCELLQGVRVEMSQCHRRSPPRTSSTVKPFNTVKRNSHLKARLLPCCVTLVSHRQTFHSLIYYKERLKGPCVRVRLSVRCWRLVLQPRTA